MQRDGADARIAELEAGLTSTLAYHKATAEILEVISRSPNELQPVLDAIAERAARLCEAIDCVALLRIGDRLAHRAHFGPILLDVTELPVSRGTVSARCVVERKTIHVHDIQNEQESYPEGSEVAQRVGYHTVLGAPLMRDNEAIGSLVLRRMEVKPFSDEQIGLVRTFAAQAVIAVENARLFEAEQLRTQELQEALEYQTAISIVLGLIASSRTGVGPVLETVAESACRLCEAFDGVILLRTGDELQIRAHYGPILEGFTNGPVTRGWVNGRSVVDGMQIHIADLQSEVENFPEGAAAARRLGFHTILATPLLRKGEAIGTIVMRRSELRPFSDKQLELVRTFADQAVIAIENARLFEAEQVKTRELNEALIHQSAAAEVLETISASPGSVAPVYEAILSRALQHCDSRFGVLLRPSNEGYRLAAHLGLPDELVDVLAKTPFVPAKGTGIARAIAAGAPAQSPDIQNVELYPDPEAARTDAFRTAVANLGGGRSAVSVPLMKEGELVGVFIIFRTQVQPFSDKQVALLRTFADQAVIAIENARLFEQVQERSRALSELNQSLEERVNAQVNELERMGRLKRFLSPAVVNAVISSGDERLLSSHRALIAVLFADIRGFTAFCETAEPEETIEVLQTYHESMGELLGDHNVGVDQRSGDGIMAIFNDPLPCDDPAGDAVRLALGMRERMQILCARWKRLGHHLGFGVGITLGYATVGLVGSEGRYDYTASGTTVNLAARLCDEAVDGEILLSPRACTAVEDQFETTHHGAISFKGIQVPVEVHRLIGVKNS